ncbi:MAG: LysR family transcriptional regulator [Sphingobium sp.]
MQFMNWGDLPYFLAVARHGQLAKAASLLRADATTVSRRIRRLEQSMQTRLFEQGDDGRVLTLAGRNLLRRAEAMERLAQDAATSTQEAGSQSLTGTVRISVAEGFGTWFISQHLASFANAYPQLEIDLVANSGFLNPTRRETDLAILLARPRKGPLVTRKLTGYRLGLYASHSYLRSAPKIIDAIDMKKHRLIGYIPDVIYAPELRYLDELPFAGHAQLRSSSINAQHQIAVAGAGIGILPGFIADPDAQLSRILPSIKIERSFWLTTHRETRGFPAVRAFSQWLVQLVAENQHLLHG